MGLTELGVPVGSDEADRAERSAQFKEMLRVEREKNFTALAENPARSKVSTIGQMIYCVQQMIREGLWEKALVGLKTISQLEGWIGAEVTNQVYLGLSQREIDEARAKLSPVKKPISKEIVQ